MSAPDKSILPRIYQVKYIVTRIPGKTEKRYTDPE